MPDDSMYMQILPDLVSGRTFLIRNMILRRQGEVLCVKKLNYVVM